MDNELTAHTVSILKLEAKLKTEDKRKGSRLSLQSEHKRKGFAVRM